MELGCYAECCTDHGVSYGQHVGDQSNSKFDVWGLHICDKAKPNKQDVTDTLHL